jgi:hypothetical protein
MDAIKDIPKGKAMSIDGLPDEAIKDIPAVRKHVVEIIKLIMSGQKAIPKYWKNARLVLLSKTGSKMALPEQTRPIAVLPVVMKVLEKVLMPHVNKDIWKNIGPYQ